MCGSGNANNLPQGFEFHERRFYRLTLVALLLSPVAALHTAERNVSSGTEGDDVALAVLHRRNAAINSFNFWRSVSVSGSEKGESSV